ncbi:hypothetical protein [Leminorella grimontii]|uniref:hypothetical protein n=1 Tax=Leminorella grimontii TaxID=82981 RepID=UPI00208C4AC0|nr:hypothetical protein [Leminorella grimontii]GKX60647.1 hypothetical protein SOASR031_29620 [Leminorella grimontii]
MSSIGNWICTAKVTFWRQTGKDKWGKPTFDAPVVIMCDYGGDMDAVKTSVSQSNIGQEIVFKNTIWTEFSEAKKGDYILIGESSEPDPIAAGADEVVHVIRWADTFERIADDYAILTG